jgi:hypothetical protein
MERHDTNHLTRVWHYPDGAAGVFGTSENGAVNATDGWKKMLWSDERSTGTDDVRTEQQLAD